MQGATSKAADAAGRAIAEAVAAREGRDKASIRKELLERVAFVLARSSVRAICKRVGAPARRQPLLTAAVARSQRDIASGDGDQ